MSTVSAFVGRNSNQTHLEPSVPSKLPCAVFSGWARVVTGVYRKTASVASSISSVCVAMVLRAANGMLNNNPF